MAVFGVGGLGLACIMMAVAAGTAKTIIAVDVSRRALDKALELGATHVIQASTTNKNNSNDELVRKQVLEITQSHGADISIDAAGFSSTCENAVYGTKRGGRMIQVGLPIGNKTPPMIPMGLVAGHELELVGSHGFAATDLPDLLKMVVEGTLDPARLIEKEVTLEEGAQAIEDMDHGSPLGISVVTKFQSHDSRL